jgi:hypothetical protein
MSRLRLIMLAALAVFAVGAFASASASAAFKLEWQTCQEKAGGHFENHGCVKEGTTKAFEWETLAAGKTKAVESKIKSKEFVLIASGIEVKCKSATDTGTITGGTPGTDEATVTFDECTTSIAGCKVKSATKPAGEVLVSGLKTKLVEGEKKNGEKVVADEFAENPTTKEFVTLEFGTKETGTPPTSKLEGKCSETIPLTTKVKGKVFAIVGISMLLKTPVNTLNVFGLAAELVGEEEQTLATGAEKGWAIRAI